MIRILLFILLAALPLAAGADDADDADMWRRLADGRHVLLVRHAATEPGVGDPPGFQLGDCKSQRNLSMAGRADAAAIAAAIRRNAVPVGRVLTSRYCRCVDTARLAFGKGEPADMLNSVFGDDDAARDAKVAAVRNYIAAHRAPGTLVLVTHDVNIRALVNERIGQGEILVTAPQPDGSLEVVGKLGVPKSTDAQRQM